MALQQRIQPLVSFAKTTINLLIFGALLVTVGCAPAYVSALAAGKPHAQICSVPGDYGTIQEAIDDHNCATIRLGSGVFNEEVTVDRLVHITGQGAAKTEVSGDYWTDCNFHVDPGGALTLTGLTISKAGRCGVYNSGGNVTIENVHIGGNDIGIINWAGTATINSSSINGNAAFGGGGIINYGDLTARNCSINDNTTGQEGGGIYNLGKATFDNCTINDNDVYGLNGGGILNRGELIVRNSTLSGNMAVSWGGGIFNDGQLTIVNSTISHTENGGGIVSSGTLTIQKSTINGNSGGGIIHWSGIATIDHSTISGNSSDFFAGSGVHNEGELTINNSTISSNSSDNEGGGLFNSAGSIILSNSMVVNTLAGPNCAGAAVTSHGYNIDSDNTCNLTAAGDMPAIDSLLGPLKGNGGATYTHALLSGSPAIDAGNCPGAGSDQRGFVRPIDMPDVPNVADACDIGAFEFRMMHHQHLPVTAAP